MPIDGFRPEWEQEGFAGQSETFEAKGKELILRAFSRTTSNSVFEHGTSRRVGKCFFVPSCGVVTGRIVPFSIERELWTGAYLEERLNAFFWGNSFERIGVWALNPGVLYKIGQIGQDTRHGVEYCSKKHGLVKGTPTGRYLAWDGGNCNSFRQVLLKLPDLPRQTDSAVREKEFKHAVLRRVRIVEEFSVLQPLNRYGHA